MTTFSGLSVQPTQKPLSQFDTSVFWQAWDISCVSRSGARPFAPRLVTEASQIRARESNSKLKTHMLSFQIKTFQHVVSPHLSVSILATMLDGSAPF